jgi:hypothetical protein
LDTLETHEYPEIQSVFKTKQGMFILMLDACKEVVPGSSADSFLRGKVGAGKFHLLMKIKLD